MSTSNKRKKRRDPAVRRYLIASAGCAVFSAVYETYSHGVISYPMVFMFLAPLLLGALPFALAPRVRADWAARAMHHTGAAFVTVGLCVAGIFQIYGTTSGWTHVYFAAGGALLCAAAARGRRAYFISRTRAKHTSRDL